MGAAEATYAGLIVGHVAFPAGIFFQFKMQGRFIH